jgi:tetratricopeptide (TPR) repeat protein
MKKKNIKKTTEKKNKIQPVDVKNIDKPFHSFNWKHVIIIALVSMAVYSNTLFMDFVYDDLTQILENNYIKSLENIPSMFISDVWAGKKDGFSPYYRPVFTLSLAIDYFIWGESPSGYHLTNILLHAMVSVMFYILALRILNSEVAAIAAGLIFAVHPVHAEAIAWTSGRNEPLSALFMFASLYLYILYRDRNKTQYIALSLFLFFTALLSKEMAITLPAVIFLYELCFRNGAIKQKIQMPLWYGLIAVIYMIVRMTILSHTSWVEAPLLWRLYTLPGIFLKYLIALIFPFNLKIFYDIPFPKTFFSSAVIVPFLISFAIILVIVISPRYDKKLFFSLFWIFVTLTPVLNIVAQVTPALMADRYLYIPSAGFSLAAGITFAKVFGLSGKIYDVSDNQTALTAHNKSSKIKMVAGLLIIGILFILTFQRNYLFKDQFSFITRMVNDAPEYFGGHYDLGLIYINQGRFDEAEKELKYALKLQPLFGKASINLGSIYFKQKRFDDAEREFQKVLQIGPDYPLSYLAYYNLGCLYFKQRRFEEAISAFQQVLKLKPDYADAYYNLGITYLTLKMTEEGILHLKKAVSLNPDNKTYKENFDKALLLKKDRIYR